MYQVHLFLNSVTRLIFEIIKFFSVHEWQETGVEFGWARKKFNSKFYPGFLLLNEKFKWITTKAELSSYAFKPFDFSEKINENLKNKAHIEHLRNFNKTKQTSFE